MIDVTGVDLVKLAQEAFRLSRPQGLGMLHYQPDHTLSGDDARQMIDKDDDRCVLSMDYVMGRACKLTVFNEDGKLYLHDSWYDHTDQQLQELLSVVNINPPAPDAEHGCACNCEDCRTKHGKGPYDAKRAMSGLDD